MRLALKRFFKWMGGMVVRIANLSNQELLISNSFFDNFLTYNYSCKNGALTVSASFDISKIYL